VTPKLYKAGEVCELLQVQPYVLRSWEKEFPGIGVQGRSPDSPRLYRQSDLEHVQRIKQLVFVEGLTVAGARRKLEASLPPISVVSQAEAAEVIDALGADVKARIANVREGLRALESLLRDTPGSSNGHAGRRTTATRTSAKQSTAKRSAGVSRSAAASRSKAAKRGPIRKAAASASRKKPAGKRRRA
jgi:DNA-binding transcriptional MerR regulator